MITKSNDTHRLKEVIKDPVAPVGKWIEGIVGTRGGEGGCRATGKFISDSAAL